MKKEAMGLKKNNEGNMGEFRGKKRKADMVQSQTMKEVV